jgi:NTE family protein
MIENLVMSGAGIKLYIFVGVLKYLEEKDILKNIKSFCGTSSGSIISVGLCLGYSVDEISELLIKLNTDNFKKIDSEGILNFFDNYGIDDAKNIERVFRIIIKAKVKDENITFKELYELTKKELIITTSNLNKTDTEFFNYKRTPDFKIIDALLCSMCVPIIYKPYIFNGNYYIDGGLTDNYPIDYFKEEKDKTLGIVILSEYNNQININSVEDYLYSLLVCLFNKLLSNTIKEYEFNTIKIYNETSFLSFDLDTQEKTNMINVGFEETSKYFENEEVKKYYELD